MSMSILCDSETTITCSKVSCCAIPHEHMTLFKIKSNIIYEGYSLKTVTHI